MEVGKLLAADTENVGHTWRLFDAFSPDLLPTFQRAVETYKLHETSVEGNVIPSGNESDQRTRRVALTRTLQVALLLRLRMLYVMAWADLLRIRVTAPLACVRIQCESLAIMKLMNDDEHLAEEWRQIRSEADGRAFYKRYQPRVKFTLRDLDLAFPYGNASSTALHSRFAGVALNIQLKSEVQGGKERLLLGLSAQEVRPDEKEVLVLMTLHVLRVQETIIARLPDSLPWASGFSGLKDERAALARAVDGLFTTFARLRPDIHQAYLAGRQGQ